MKKFVAILLACILGIGLPARSLGQPHERTVKDTLTFREGTVSVENQEGRISVSSWDRETVAYTVRILSEQSASTVEQTSIEVDEFNDRLALSTNVDDLEPQWSFGPKIFGYGVTYPDIEYEVRVPSGVSVTIDDEQSDIAVTDLSGSLRVESEEGAITVERHTGPVHLDMEEGSLDVTEVHGDVKVDTDEGGLTATSLNGRFFYEAEDGRADVSFDSLATTTIENQEGDVELSIPTDTGFDLSTDLGDGARLHGEFDLEELRDEEGNYFGSVMGGGPLLRIATMDGSVRLRRH